MYNPNCTILPPALPNPTAVLGDEIGHLRAVAGRFILLKKPVQIDLGSHNDLTDLPPLDNVRNAGLEFSVQQAGSAMQLRNKHLLVSRGLSRLR